MNLEFETIRLNLGNTGKQQFTDIWTLFVCMYVGECEYACVCVCMCVKVFALECVYMCVCRATHCC